MSKDEMIRLVQSLNSSLDIRFLEELSKVQLQGYAEHLKAVRMKKGERHEPAQARAGTATHPGGF